MPRTNEFSRATIDDVARSAGVSIATVSRVVNKTGQVSEATAARVWNAIAELSYAPHAAARGLASRRTTTIGLVMRDISGDFFGPMIRGIEFAAHEYGYDLLIHCRHFDDRTQTRIDYPLGDHNADGMIVFTNSLDENEIERLYRAQFPLVLLHRSPPDGLKIPYVAFQNKLGATRLVDYLIEVRGYHRIVFLRGPNDAEDSVWRELGYKASLASHQVDYDPTLVGVGGYNEVQAYSTIMRMLDEGIEFDAVFAADDDSAIGALQALQDRGIRVPEDVGLVGFDDIRPSSYLTPPLTTVRAPIETAGYEAVRQLINLIQTGKADLETLLPTELVIRRSCGANGQ